MKIRMSLGLMIMAAFAVAAPSWARAEASKTANVQILEPMTVAGSTLTLQPGSYEFRMTMNDPHVEILKDNKVVGQVEGHWVQHDAKAKSTEMLSDKNAIQEIDIRGQADAMRFTNG